MKLYMKMYEIRINYFKGGELMNKRLWGLMSAAMLAFTTVPGSVCAADSSETVLVTGKSPDGSYDCEVWNDQNIGEVSFDGAETEGGAFSAEWNGIHNCFFSKGHVLQSPEYATYRHFGNIDCDYEMDFTAGGVSSYGIHGWIENCNPVNSRPRQVEFYIVDGYNEFRPGGSQSFGQITDGDYTYDIYRNCLTSYEITPPEIDYYQYYSVISEAQNPVKENETVSVGRKIDIDKHFDAWRAVGLNMNGQLRDVSFYIDGWNSSGKAKLTKNELNIGTEPAPDYQILGSTSDDGYKYEVWNEKKLGEISFDGRETAGGMFSCKWDDTEYTVFSKGRFIPSGKTYQELPGLCCDYALDYTPHGTSYFGIHGWFTDCKGEYPTTEYFIMDGCCDWALPEGTELLGSTVIDGGCYALYRVVLAKAPTITGVQDYCQYWSVGGNSVTKANTTRSFDLRISIDEHFKAWEKAGLDMSGKLYEASFFVEGHHSSGEAKITKNQLSFSDDPQPAAAALPQNGTSVKRISGRVADGTYDYEVLNYDRVGEVSFDGAETEGGAFSAEWNDIRNCMVSKGHVFQTAGKTYTELGSICCKYKVELSQAGVSCFGVRGWLRNSESGQPETEYYIVDGFSQFVPLRNAESLGQVKDGSRTYDIFRIDVSPADAPETCYQYWSIIIDRENHAKNNFPISDTAKIIYELGGWISVDKHFKAWEDAGLEMSGQVGEVSFFIENWQSIGKAKVTMNNIEIANLPEADAVPQPSAEAITGDINCDGRTDVSDAVLLARYLNQDAEAVMTDQGKVQANVIKGELDSEDLSAILMFIAKKIPADRFPLDSLPAAGDASA